MTHRFRPAAIVLLVTTVAAAGILWMILTPAAVRVNVRWASTLGDAERASLETRFHLTAGSRSSGTTYTYILGDRSTGNIRALVQHPAAEDTDGINRARFRPFNAYQHEERVGAIALGVGAIAALGWILAPFVRRRARRTFVLSPRSIVLTMTAPALLLIACSAVMLAGALLGVDPLWFSTQATNQRGSGTTPQAPMTADAAEHDGSHRALAVPDQATGKQPRVACRPSGTPDADAACADGTRVATREDSIR